VKYFQDKEEKAPGPAVNTYSCVERQFNARLHFYISVGSNVSRMMWGPTKMRF
jgi:hypothetical protein